MGLLSGLLWSCLVVSATSQTCSVFDSANTARQMAANPRSRGNTYFGLVLPVHRPDVTSGAVCGPISAEDVIKTEAFFWALRTFWKRWSEFGSFSQHGIVFDSCSSPDRLYPQLHTVEYGSAQSPAESVNVLAYLVADRQAVTVRMTKLLRSRNTTVLSTSLNDPGVRVAASPTLYHMSPTVTQEADAVLKLLSRSGWGYVQVLYSIDGYGKEVYDAFIAGADGYDVSVGRSEMLDDENMTPDIDAHPVIVVIFAYADQKIKILSHLGNKDLIIVTTNIAGDVWTSVKSSAGSSKIVELRSSLNPIYNIAVQQFQHEVLEKFTSTGTASTANPWFAQFWETIHRCYITEASKALYTTPCDPSVQLGKSSIPHPQGIALIIQAADLMVKALGLTCPGTCPVDELSNKRRNFNSQFQTVGFETDAVFNAKTLGPVTWNYDVFLFSWSDAAGRLTDQKVGYIEESSLSIDKLSEISLKREVTGSAARVILRPIRLNEEDGTRYGIWGYIWTIVIAVLAGIGIILVLVIALLLCILASRGSMSSYVWLYAVLLFGAFLGYLTLFAYIPVPTTATCGIIRFGVGISYGICFSVMVILGLLLCKKAELFSSTRVSTIFIAVSLILLISIELVILVIWMIWTPPGVAYVLYPGFLGPRRICNHFTLGVGGTFLRTVFENHLLRLIYIMLLILVVLLLAIFIFMRRKYLRASRDKTESYALLAAGIGTGLGTVVIWLVWTLIGALRGQVYNDVHNYGDAAMAFGLWFTLTWLLVFLLVQIIYAWRSGSNVKAVKKEITVNLSTMNDNHVIAKESEYKEGLTTVDGRVSQHDSLNKAPLIMQANGGNSYTSYEHHVETRTENKLHHRPAPVPEHEELEHTHQHVFTAGSNFCAQCGFEHDPTALRLVHPRSENSSHNTSLEYNVHSSRLNEGLSHERRMATSQQALHLLHPRSRPVSRAGSLDMGQKRVVAHGANTRVARSEIGSNHVTHGHHNGSNVIDLRRPRHFDKAYYYPSNLNTNVYFTEHSAKGTSII